VYVDGQDENGSFFFLFSFFPGAAGHNAIPSTESTSFHVKIVDRRRHAITKKTKKAKANRNKTIESNESSMNE